MAGSTARVMPGAWPLPALNDKTRPFFTSGRLLLQTCLDCGFVQHPPEDVCGRCQGMHFEYREHPARGHVYSHTEVTHPIHPALAEAVPYTVALISLDDPAGLRIVGNLVRVEPGALRVGLRVRAEWIEVAHEESGEVYRLPQWAPAEGSPGDP